jgi:hypothetical protein
LFEELQLSLLDFLRGSFVFAPRLHPGSDFWITSVPTRIKKGIYQKFFILKNIDNFLDNQLL